MSRSHNTKRPLERQQRAAMPSFVQPMLPTPIKLPFTDPDFVFEPKWDGFRALCFLHNGRFDSFPATVEVSHNAVPNYRRSQTSSKLGPQSSMGRSSRLIALASLHSMPSGIVGLGAQCASMRLIWCTLTAKISHSIRSSLARRL